MHTRKQRGTSLSGHGIRKRSSERMGSRCSPLRQGAKAAEVTVGEHERPFFRFIGEQNAARVGQLCRAFGIYRADMERLLTDLEKNGLVESKRFITGDDVWVWPTRRGIKLAGLGLGYREPHYRNLAHWGAITDARIDLEQRVEGIEWICERALRAEQKGRLQGYVPDAVAVHRVATSEGEAEFRYAIEVELSPKSAQILEDKISSNERRYDSIVYFAVPRVYRKFAALGLVDRHPKLQVEEIPDVSRYLEQPLWRIPGDPGPLPNGSNFDYSSVDLSELELEVVDLIAEQGMVPMDQLEAFFDFGPGVASELVSRLVQKRVLARAKPLFAEPPWVWITRVGAKTSRTGLHGIKPSISRLELRRAANQVRLSLTKGTPGVRWISSRVLEQNRGGPGAAPVGVIELKKRVLAVDILSSVSGGTPYANLLARRLEEGYDGAIWFYGRRSGWAVTAFWEGLSDRNRKRLKVGPLPTGEHLPMAPETAKITRRPPPKPTLLEELERRPARLRKMPTGIVRSGCLEAVSEMSRGDDDPSVLEAWVELGSRGVRWVLTEEGFFRVVQFGQWTQVDRIERECLYVKEEGTLLWPKAEKHELRRRAVKRYEINERAWAAVEAAIPPELRRIPASAYAGTLRSDRALLSGAIWSLRNGVSVKDVASSLGFGGGRLIYRRLRELETAGLWDEVKQILVRELPDGELLDWARLDPLRTQCKSVAVPERHETDDQVWTLVEGVLDQIDGLSRNGGATGWISDRAALSAGIWRLREGVDWQAVGKSGYCSERPARDRIRKWEEGGAWRQIRTILETHLPDGEELDWWRLEHAEVRQRGRVSVPHREASASRFNYRQRAWLSRMQADPSMEFSRSQYSREMGVGPKIGGQDLRALAEIWLVVGKRCPGGGFRFSVPKDLRARLRRLESG